MILSAPKRRINLTVAGDVVDAANDAGLNLSRIAEDALREAVRETRRRAWEREHAGAIAAYNARVEADGLWSDDLRTF